MNVDVDVVDPQMDVDVDVNGKRKVQIESSQRRLIDRICINLTRC